MTDFTPVRLAHQGADLEGRFMAPEGQGPWPAVLLMPSAMGVCAAYLRIARRLVDQGYAVLVSDMYGAGVCYTAVEDVTPVLRAVQEDGARLRDRVVAWYDVIKARPGVDPGRIAAIGYCFGGQCVLELARAGADVKAVVSYHGLLKTHAPARKGEVKARVVVYAGEKDPYAPAEDVDGFLAEVRGAEALWHLTLFGDAFHAFTTEEDGVLPIPGVGYDPLADAVSWAGTLALLQAVL